MLADMTKAQVRGRKTTVTFAYMYKGAKCMLELAENSREGQLYTTVAALVFSAFTLEAYLNHLGKLRNKEWDEIERKYSKFEKYKLFASASGIKFDCFRVRPYCTLKELFEFRDRMAHGKTTTENIDLSINIVENLLPQLNSESDWQAFATLEKAQIAIKDVELLVKELHLASGYSGNPFSKLGGGVYGITHERT
jgi:hypothetical protein